MPRPVICTSCKEVLEPTYKDYVVCGNCGEFNWIGPENRYSKEDFEPDIRERFQIAKKKIIKANG
jgi:hypothetical protein